MVATGKVIAFRAVDGDGVTRAQERFFRTLDAAGLPEALSARLRQAALALASEASRESFVNGAVVWGAPAEKAEAFWRSAYALATLGSEQPPAPDLHPRTQAVLDCIRSFVAEHGYAPTVREIGLVDAGLIRRDPMVARGIVLLGGAA